MDISEFDNDQTSLTLIHPITEEETDIVITGYVPDSTPYRKLQKEIHGKEKAQSILMAKNRKERNRIEIDPATSEKDEKVLIRSITDIQGLVVKKKKFQYSPEATIELFKNTTMTAWMIAQWREHLSDRSNFLGSGVISANSGESVSDG